jgi:hypothetical protein
MKQEKQLNLEWTALGISIVSMMVYGAILITILAL